MERQQLEYRVTVLQQEDRERVAALSSREGELQLAQGKQAGGLWYEKAPACHVCFQWLAGCLHTPAITILALFYFSSYPSKGVLNVLFGETEAA